MAIVQINGALSTSVFKTRTWAAVFAKRTWGGRWRYLPYVFPTTATEAAMPSISTASFHYDFGLAKREDRTTYATYRPWQLKDAYIAIVGYSRFGQFNMWIGKVTELTLAPDGFIGGEEAIQAKGLEFLFDRRRIDKTYTDDGKVIDRPVVFNKRFTRGATLAGNRSSSRNAANIFTFSKTDTNEWTNLDILQYVIQNFQTDAPNYRFVGQAYVLDQIVERHNLHGLSVLDAVNKLIDRRRGLGWRLLTNGSGTINIYVYSILSDPIWLGETSIPANPYQDVLRFDQLIDIKPQVTYSTRNQYDTIKVRGSAIRVCGSLSHLNYTLEPAWTPAEEIAYEAATDAERGTDKYGRVFTTFRTPKWWTRAFVPLNFVLSSVPVENQPVASFALNQTFAGFVFGDLTNPGDFWDHDNQFERETLIEEVTSLSQTEKEFREAFAIGFDTPQGAFKFVDRMKNEVIKSNQKKNLRLTILDRDMSIQVRGIANHLLGLDEFGFGGFGNFDDPPSPETSVDAETTWRDLIVTLAWDTDIRLGVDLKRSGPTESGKDLFLDVEGAEYWWIAPGTVSDVTDGDLVYNNGGLAETIRDDSQRLRAIAVTAAAWYGAQRQIIEYAYEGLAPFHPVGMLIRGAIGNTIGMEPIGTVVTERKWSFTANRGFGETRIKTGYGELDVRLAQ